MIHTIIDQTFEPVKLVMKDSVNVPINEVTLVVRPVSRSCKNACRTFSTKDRTRP